MSHAPWSVCLCVMCTPVSPAKTDKPIEMRVVADAWCPRSHVLRIERSVHGSAPAVGVGGALSDTAIRRSVCLSQGVAAVGYRHAGCLLLSHPACPRDVRTADPSADGRRSAASRIAIGGGLSSGRPRGDSVYCCCRLCN